MRSMEDGGRLGTIFQVKVLTAGDGDSTESSQSPLRFRACDGTYYVTCDEMRSVREMDLGIEVVREIPEAEIPVRFFQIRHGEVADPPADSARLAVLARLLSEERANGDVHVRYLGRNRSVPADGFIQDRAGGDRSYVWQIVPRETLQLDPDIEERFACLREHFADPDTRVVLSLGSGGVKLFAHATALRMLEMLDCARYVDEIWGSSAGSVVGLLYSHGLSPQAIEQSGYDLYAGRYDLAIRPSKFQFLRHIIRDTFLPTDEPGAAGFVDCTQGLARMLDQYCAEFTTRVPFYCLAFNLEECRPEVLTPEEIPEHLDEFLVRTDAREAALASATVPLLFVPRRVRRSDREVLYIDGSTTEDVPLYSPVRKWDMDRRAGVERRKRLLVFSVKLTSSLAQYRSGGARMGKLRLLQTVASAGIQTMHERNEELVSGRDDVRLISLQFGDASPDFFDVSRIPEFIRVAKESFPKQLAEIESQLRSER